MCWKLATAVNLIRPTFSVSSMSDLTLVGPSQDPAGLSLINLEELSATSTAEIEQTDVALHASQPACLSSIRLKEQITTTTALEQKDQVGGL